MVKLGKYKKTFISLDILGLILVAILGYFTYDGVNGALAMIGMYLVLILITFIAIVPYIGVFLQQIAMTQYVFPYLFNIMHIQASVVTDIMFVYFTISGIIIWLVSTFVVSLIIVAIADALAHRR